jgi:1-deoxy-D-xylulose-5-phosphate reductoisomerase
VIEAHWLFDVAAAQIEVLIHPQSTIHSMVEFVDGSTLAQLGTPDMRTPIASALAWPERIASGSAPLDWTRAGPFTFEQADYARFPCLKLALDALREEGAASAILNASNEIAVEAFLSKKIRFTDIARVVESTLNKQPREAIDTLDDVLAVDEAARAIAKEIVWTLR